MNRRTFLCGLTLGPLGTPLIAEAQQARKVPKLGVLSFGDPPSQTRRSDPNEGFRGGLRELGYVEGGNVTIEWRYAETRIDRLAQLAAELVRLKVDVLHVGGPVVLEAARKASTTIPIVAVSGGDAVGEGWAKSIARPGGNVTGLTVTYPEVGPKRLEILKEAIPKLSRVATLRDPAEALVAYLKALENGARVLGLQLQVLEVRGPNDFDRAFSVARQERAEALHTTETAMIFFHRVRLAELAASSRLASIGEFRPFAEAGFLMTYGSDLRELHRRAATYVDKILKGARAGDLPVERPTKFELVINLKTARALGLTIPRSLLLRADEVIE